MAYFERACSEVFYEAAVDEVSEVPPEELEAFPTRGQCGLDLRDQASLHLDLPHHGVVPLLHLGGGRGRRLLH